MRFWTSSETHKNIGHEKTKLLSHIIEPKINEFISKKDYGTGLELWAYMTISLPEGIFPSEFFNEIKKYRKNQKEVELRLIIDNKKLSEGDNQETLMLFCKSILRSIDLAESELKIVNFDFKMFRADLNAVFKREGWIK